MSLKEFILSRQFAKNLGIAVSVAIGAVILLLLWLNIYTRHGQARTVPDFYGRSLEEVEKIARKNRFRYQVMDSVYTTLVGKGCVTEQNPKPGFRVKKWRRIVLTINAFNPEMVAMPDLVGLPKRQALAVIESSGLEPGQLRYIPDLSIDFVIKQIHTGREITAGDSLQKGSVIDLVLGKGLSNERTPVPQLVGQKFESAKNSILAASLNLGAFLYDASVLSADDSAEAFVYKQNPEYRDDATLQLGSAIYLWLTTDSARLPADSTLVSAGDSVIIPDNQ